MLGLPGGGLTGSRIVRRTSRGQLGPTDDLTRGGWSMEGGLVGDPIGALANFIHNAFVWLQTLVRGGFGLLIIPIGVLGLISLWLAFHHR
jgi:hypothetical protein